MMMEMFQILLQAVFTFFALLLLTRILGKKQMSHLTFFNIIKKRKNYGEGPTGYEIKLR